MRAERTTRQRTTTTKKKKKKKKKKMRIGEGKRRIARIEGNDEEKVVEEEAEGEERVSTATAKDERASFGTGPSSSMLTNLLSVTTHTRKCSMRDVRSPRSPEDI